MLKIFSDCVGGGRSSKTANTANTPEATNLRPRNVTEKWEPTHRTPAKPSLHDVAADLITTLHSADQVSTNLQRELEAIVREAGWWDEAVAKAVLAMLEKTLEAGKEMNVAMREAYEKAYAEAIKIKELTEEHPVLTGIVCTVVAIGILYLLWPEIIAALGFGELGPIEGSFAAGWQSLYGARVPIGSIFSYLQRLGMTVRG